MKSGKVKLSDERVLKALSKVAKFTGESAAEHFDSLLGDVKLGKWREFEFLLQTTRHFGGLVLFASDGDEESHESQVLSDGKQYDWRVTGIFRPADAIVEVVVGRLTTWNWVEFVYRHELVHLLQNATGTLETEDTNLVSDHLRYGKALAKRCRSYPFDDSAQEAEAYAVMKETKHLRAWALELKRKPELTATWARPTRQQDKLLVKQSKPLTYCSTIDLEDK